MPGDLFLLSPTVLQPACSHLHALHLARRGGGSKWGEEFEIWDGSLAPAAPVGAWPTFAGHPFRGRSPLSALHPRGS